jgi:hypothetical protein
VIIPVANTYPNTIEDARRISTHQANHWLHHELPPALTYAGGQRNSYVVAIA